MSRLAAALFYAFLVGISLAPDARAQEVQVALDERGSLTVVDAELEARLDLFPEYAGFREARLFRLPDGSFVLAVRYESDGELVQDRNPLTPDEAASLRQRVTQAMTQANLRPELDQGGRVRLLRTAAIMSLLAYGPSLAAVLQVDDATAAGTIVLLTGAAGFFVPYYLTQTMPVTQGAGSLATSGAVLGYAHGVALAGVLGGSEVDSDAVVGAGLVVSIAEALAAYRFATSTGLRHGAAENITQTSVFGAGLGFGVSVLALGEEWEDEDAAIRLVSGLGLLGSAAGAYAGYRLTRAEVYSRGDARIASTAGIIGLQVGAAILEASGAESARPAAGTLIATTAAGLATGHALTRGKDFSTSQGNFIALSSVAGGLVGGAVSNIVGASLGTSAVLGSLGSIAGFARMYRGYSDEATARSGRALDLSLAPSFDPVDRTIRPAFSLRASL